MDMFTKIISFENLYAAFDRFRAGKRTKPGVPEFEYSLENNIIQLRRELEEGSYVPSPPGRFTVREPKPRPIEAAQVRDRVAHHALYHIINPLFERGSIFDSFACRARKGPLRAALRLEHFWRKASKNYTRKIYFLKCDIRRYFPSVNLDILKSLIWKKIPCPRTRGLIEVILRTQYVNNRPGIREKGLPIGNLTSQIFANLYLNPFDHFVKHILKVKYYIRYMDDFVCVSPNRDFLTSLIAPLRTFLQENLALNMHPQKRKIYSSRSGMDFTGYFIRARYKTIRHRNIHRFINRLESYKEQKKGSSQITASIFAWKGYAMQASSYGLLKDLCDYFSSSVLLRTGFQKALDKERQRLRRARHKASFLLPKEENFS